MHVVANRGLFLAFTVEAPRRGPLTQRRPLGCFYALAIVNHPGRLILRLRVRVGCVNFVS